MGVMSSKVSPMKVRHVELIAMFWGRFNYLDMNPKITRNNDYNDDYADDIEDVHCL
jgi:hypothetical protein